MQEDLWGCNHREGRTTVSLFWKEELAHSILCEKCFIQQRDSWQIDKLKGLDFIKDDPCELCRSSALPTRMDEEYMCHMCFNCMREQLLSFNQIMEIRTGSVSQFELPTCILDDSIYLGSHHSSVSKEGLAMFNIRQVIVCCSHLPEYHNQDDDTINSIIYHRIPLGDFAHDFLSPNVLQYVCHRLEAAESQRYATLIHCYAGVSRSASICIAWLMKRNRWDFETAFNFVKTKRPIICPNNGFIRQLKEWERFCNL